ncbi:uncharacterized protein F5891DRAFT_984546 [Suillus fuscotomentosus]|uniref:Crinkler effector protein N-terminal domain-containing protein n=1 Tax=Suillus fuscotomentosus TaxID=1912939 RepID=A0AAD4DX01_9AGAM|nr:uncharacterized protein F5891DRAFT_984546 [Suillus fuscotomentosus]KAG1895096.1 hypothetical protein F5891DRAFT_984546 [Suillus fuscotomentosus]
MAYSPFLLEDPVWLSGYPTPHLWVRSGLRPTVPRKVRHRPFYPFPGIRCTIYGEKWIKAWCGACKINQTTHDCDNRCTATGLNPLLTHKWCIGYPERDENSQAWCILTGNQFPGHGMLLLGLMSGPLHLKLNCIVLGNNPRRIFPVDIEWTEIVGDLKEVIKDKKRPEFDHVATDRLELWKVDLPIDEMIEHNLNNLTLDPTKSLSPVDEMVEIFPDAPPRKYLHIIIQCPPAVSSGPLHLKLNCIVFGDDPRHIFPVNVERTKTVGDLKNVIKVAKKPEFDHVAANRLELWKVKINWNDIDLRNAILDGGVELHPLTELSDVFADGIERGCIHIVIQHPAIARHIPAVDRRIAYLKKGVGSPSAGVKPSAFSMKQDQQEYLCNRPHRAADPVPITLLEPIFAEFVDDCQNRQPTVRDNNVVLQLSEKMAAFYPTELARMNTFRQVLRDYGIILNASMVGLTGCTMDRHLLSTNRQFVLMIIEGKNEIGCGAAKPFMEAMLYYRKFMEDSKVEIARLRSFIPCIHIIVFGACIGFSGSVFNEKVQSDVLVPIIPLFWHSTDLHMQVMAARTFGALKIAVEKLTNLYSRPIPSLAPEDPYLKWIDLSSWGKPSAMWLGARYASSLSGTIPLRLTNSVPARGTPPNLSPTILYPAAGICEISVLDRQPLKETITSLIRELHNHNDGYVHGDLRDTNFLVQDDKHFMLLDFDWAGPIQKTHYPMYVNQKDIRRFDGSSGSNGSSVLRGGNDKMITEWTMTDSGIPTSNLHWLLRDQDTGAQSYSHRKDLDLDVLMRTHGDSIPALQHWYYILSPHMIKPVSASIPCAFRNHAEESAITIISFTHPVYLLRPQIGRPGAEFCHSMPASRTFQDKDSRSSSWARSQGVHHVYLSGIIGPIHLLCPGYIFWAHLRWLWVENISSRQARRMGPTNYLARRAEEMKVLSESLAGPICEEIRSNEPGYDMIGDADRWAHPKIFETASKAK